MIPFKTCVAILLFLLSLTLVVHAEDALWTCNTNHEITCLELSPDAAYVVAGGERIYCMDREGTLLWHEHSGDDLQFIKAGSIIVGLRNNFLHFIDLEGKLSHREEITEDVAISDIVAISDDGTEYYVLGSDCSVYAKEGDESLDTRIDHMEQPSNVLMNWNTARIVAIEGDGLHCYSAKSGSSRWEHDDRGGKAVMTEDGVYVIYGTGNRISEISALHGEKGERDEIWESRIEGDVLSMDVSEVDDGDFLLAVGTRDATQNSVSNYVYLLDGNGQQIWRKQCAFWVYSVDITPSGNYIAAGSLEKKVFLFDRAGNLCKEVDTSEPVRFVRLNEEENFGVAADAHNVYAFTLEGETTPAAEVNPSPSVPPASAPTPVYTPTRPPEPPIKEAKLVDRGEGEDRKAEISPDSDRNSSEPSQTSGVSGVFLEFRSALTSFFKGLFSTPAAGS
jgi:WD40 repeat protein